MKATKTYAMIGEEPVFVNGGTRLDIMKAYNWYSYACDVSTSRRWIVDYMKANDYDKEDIKTFMDIKDDRITLTLCSSARMLMRGAKLDWDINPVIKNMIGGYTPIITKPPKKDENTLLSDLEVLLDRFYSNSYIDDFDVADVIRSADSKPWMIKEAIEHFGSLQDEIQAIYIDVSLKEAYSHLKKVQIKAYAAFVNRILSTLTNESINKKRATVRKPRKIKEKSAAQLTKKVQYQTQDIELNATSLTPDKIIGATTAYLFNTKTRKLAKYQAIEGQTLTVKGTTIQNFDEKASSQKTIRKPKDVVSMVVSEAKIPLAKAYEKIKATAGAVNGRISGTTLILRTMK